MKCIVLAKMGKRILAAICDLLITLAVSMIIFFALVLPLSLDKDLYYKNQKTMFDVMYTSNLYIRETIDETEYTTLILDNLTSQLKSNKDEKAIDYLNKFTYKEKDYYAIDSLYRFYSEEHFYGGEKIFNETTSSYDTIAENIFKVGSDSSNIKSLELDPIDNKYKISCTDLEKRNITFDFIANAIKNENDNDSFTSCLEIITHSIPFKNANDSNKQAMLNSILLTIPTLFGASFIFYFIIPICSKNGETIGKYLTKICVLSQDGYVLKKPYYIIRFLVFFIFEFALGILTFGGSFLISYIMFCFSKKRRCLHDALSNSIVVDKQESNWFYDREQEYNYNYKTRI